MRLQDFIFLRVATELRRLSSDGESCSTVRTLPLPSAVEQNNSLILSYSINPLMGEDFKLTTTAES